MRVLDASQVRAAFARVVDSVADDREAIVITRYGRPLAALVPLTRLSRIERAAIRDGNHVATDRHGRDTRPGRLRAVLPR
jgi:prevent-host-death family protein